MQNVLCDSLTCELDHGGVDRDVGHIAHSTYASLRTMQAALHSSEKIRHILIFAILQQIVFIKG